MSPALATFLFEAANFLLLAGGLGWVLFRPVRAALDNERSNHQRGEEEVRRLRAQAESVADEARAARTAVEREIAQQRAAILAAAQKEAARILEEAREAQSAERRILERELEAARGAQAQALTESLATIAAESVRRLLWVLQGPALDLALVRAACNELRALSNPARRSAVVESARALDAEARRLLEEVLGGGFDERTVDELGAGVRVTTSAGQIDASALSVARETACAIRAHFTAEARAARPADA